MGFPSYFIVVADFINWAKDNGIAGRARAAVRRPARWSPTSLGITDVDPIPFDLLFERFLNPDRVTPPDIDIDFDDRRRSDVIRYVTEKYGDDKVAMIATFGRIKAKAAIKDSSRILGYPFAMGDRITKAMPPDVMGKSMPLSGVFDPQPPALRRGRRDPRDVRAGRGRQEGHRHRPRRRGPDPPARRARRRRHHLPGDDHRPRAGHDAPRRRRHHHAVRLPDLRGNRPDQDGLPGAQEPDDHHRRAEQRRDHHRPEAEHAGVPARRPADLRAAVPGRHARACSSSTAARCARCCGRCARTTSKTSRPSSPCTAPGPWVRTRTSTTPSARTTGSRSRRSTRSWRSR